MDALMKNTVHIKDRKRVEEIMSQLIKGTASKLQVIADFDYTLSRVHKDGQKCPSTFGVFTSSPLIDEGYTHETNCLYNHYHPIEIDPHLSKEEKIPHLMEWYEKEICLLSKYQVTSDSISKMVCNSSLCLRDGCDALFESLHQSNVPLLIFSAGVGDIIQEALRHNKLLFPNVKIISNFLKIDEKNHINGFKGDLIHTFNKNEGSVNNKDYFQDLSGRNNVILLGDSLGDLEMSKGVHETNQILKIGFLNFNIDAYLPQYLEAYDIVLTDDQTMDIVHGILKSIL